MLTALALAAAFAQPAAAITFPSLTTIYLGTGVVDDTSIANTGLATSFLCTNVSGVSANIRYLVLDKFGAVAAQITQTVGHGSTSTVSTHNTTTFDEISLPTIQFAISQGAVNIESTQSGVFCSAYIVDAADAVDIAPINLVRVNPHPGTVE